MKELYHKLEHSHTINPYYVKEEIQVLVKDFDKLIDNEGAAFDNFAEENLITFRGAISQEISDFS